MAAALGGVPFLDHTAQFSNGKYAGLDHACAFANREIESKNREGDDQRHGISRSIH
jgi:hypothetical protein